MLFCITFFVISSAIIISIVLSLCCVNISWKVSEKFEFSQEPEFYLNGAVAADNVFCSRVGNDVLKENGTAVDAAIAACFCLGVVNMHSSGIGGGGALIAYSPNKTDSNTPFTIDYYDYRETSPIRINRIFDKMNANDIYNGPLSIAVPSEVHGMYTAWKKHGRLPWERLLEPSIQITLNGYPMHRRLYEASNYMIKTILKDDGLRELLIKPNSNQTWDKDSMIKNEPLHKTLKIIAADPMSFYKGILAKTIVREIQLKGGIMGLNDLKNYKTIIRTPIINDLVNNYTLYSASAPFSGSIISLILNILGEFNITALDKQETEVNGTVYHYMAEAMKFGFSFRNVMSDPDYDKANVTQKLTKLLSKTELSQILREKIDNVTHDIKYYSIDNISIKEDHGTTHVSVIAPDGSAASMTNSINVWFGSGFRSRETGIIYNNQMDDFGFPNHTNSYNLKPSKENFPEPGKRPFSSISPSIIVKDGKLNMAIGASGGTRIITSLASVIFFKLWLNDTLNEAIERPRIHHQLIPNALLIDRIHPISNETLYELSKIHLHNLTYSSIPELSSVQGVLIDDDGKIWAKSDSRKYGQAIGF